MLAELITGRGLVMVVYPDAGSWSIRTTAQFVTQRPGFSNEDKCRWAGMLGQVARLNGGDVLLGGCCNTDAGWIAKLRDVCHDTRP
jgi:S-methylmethionine-dependent homocysteine/selenocysteine methylase